MGLPAVQFAVWTEPASRTRESIDLALPIQCSDAVFAAAAIELYARLWEELEVSGRAEDETDLALRLEVYLLFEALDSIRWRTILSPHSSTELRNVLESIARAIGVSSEARTLALFEAQNALFDSVLILCRRAVDGRGV